MLAAPQQDRFESLDVLRGVAVLGILAINIQAMALPGISFSNPTLNPGLFDGSGKDIWSFVSVFFQFKFVTIFSALFGAGIILMLGEEKPSPKFKLHYRRMSWLLLIGVFHAYVIWFGDILTPYAIAGMIVVLARRWRPRTLFIVGFILIALTYAAFLAQHFALEAADPEQRAEMLKPFMPSPDMINAEIASYRGAFPARTPGTAGTALVFQLVQSLLLGPRNIGVMMFGMALYKLGFFTLGWPMLRYLIWGAIALGVGLAGSAFATHGFLAQNFDPMKIALAQAAQYWGSLPHAFGYSAIIMAICKIPMISYLRLPFAAAGRMALTNYLMCSIIGVALFYGPPGLSLIGKFSYEQQATTVLIIWAATLIWSPLWLASFRFGPFEWLWRSLTYWRRQPMLRKGAHAA